VFQALKENNCPPRLLSAINISFAVEGKIKTFYDKN
jgi:hypothetical protein